MVTFVGAEYIIANSLIAMSNNKKRAKITLGELNQLGIYIKEMSIEEDVNAVFLVSQDQVATAMFDFSDYFEYDEFEKTICIRQSKKVDDLASRFIGYLPWDVTAFLVKTTNKFVQQAA